MNEFIDEQSVSRLVGDFARPEGQLTSKLRYNPNCVLLFDEIEKAHPEVHNLLLQVLGEGRLTDALGRTVSFAGTVIIMTSNLGAERARKEINLMGREDLASSTYRKAVMDFFRPEFINRIDEIVIFDRLSEKHMARIAWLQINGLLKRHGLARRHSLLNLSEDALTQIAARGFDPEFGGRALKRQIEKEMTVLIAEQLVTMPPDNPLILEVDWREGRLQPRVISLEHISRDPAAEVAQPGGEAIEKKHFEALAEKLGELREHILDYEEEQEASWNLLEALQEDASLESLIDIKEEISELEVELKEILWNYETRKKVDLSRANLNLKRLDVRDPYFFADLYNRLHVQDFLHETLQAADYILREGESTYFSLRHKLAWLNYLLSNFVEKGSDLFLLELKPLIRQGLSQREQQYVLDYLASLYADVFPLQEKTQQSGRLFLHFQGPGLLSIFQQEKGVHLAFLSNTQLLPVELILHPLNGEQSPSAFLESYLSEAGDRAPSQPKDRQAKQVKSVVRVYSFEGGGRAAAIWEAACRTARESGEPLPFSRGPNLVKGTITDLRSGLMQHAGLSAEEVRMLFYANFPQPYKFFLP
jgi:ATP-dependent Clp protease ATP-binding subunit ClpC